MPEAQESWRPGRLEPLARENDPVRVAVVCPEDGPSLIGALESRNRGLIEAVLVGHGARIRQAGGRIHG